MVVIVRVGDVLAVDIIQLDFEAVGFNPRVIDAVEVVEAAVGNGEGRGRQR